MIIDSAQEVPDPDDGLIDFGSPAAEVKEEADEALDAADEVMGADIPALPIVNA